MGLKRISARTTLGTSCSPCSWCHESWHRRRQELSSSRQFCTVRSQFSIDTIVCWDAWGLGKKIAKFVLQLQHFKICCKICLIAKFVSNFILFSDQVSDTIFTPFFSRSWYWLSRHKYGQILHSPCRIPAKQTSKHSVLIRAGKKTCRRVDSWIFVSRGTKSA